VGSSQAFKIEKPASNWELSAFRARLNPKPYYKKCNDHNNTTPQQQPLGKKHTHTHTHISPKIDNFKKEKNPPNDLH
jgi:hypothetical protein